MNVKKFNFLNFPVGIKKMVIFGLIGVFLLSGCEQIKELYGIQPSGEEGYVPLEEIKIEGDVVNDLPPMPPDEEVPGVVEEVTEVPEEIVEITEEPEEIVEEPPKEGAKVIIAEETELISLQPKASDPDADKLTFAYSTPLDNEGKWQTKYGDAGEYTITITASDGQLSATKDVLVIVNKKEETPVIDESAPNGETLTAKENSKIEFSVKASDLNKDPLAYSWKLDGSETSTKQSYTYDIGYDGAGQHTVKVVVSDNVKETSKIWAVKVDNVNRKPVLKEIKGVAVKETETVVLEPEASDPDDDGLTFDIDSDKFSAVDGRFEWKTTYDDAGEYNVKVTVSDGGDEVSQTVKVTVENVNRAPVIEDIILG